jgi:hypothetical protein
MTPEESWHAEIREALNTAAETLDDVGGRMLGEIHSVLAQRAAVACRVALETDCSVEALLDASDSLLIAAGGLYVMVDDSRRERATRLYETALGWRRLCSAGFEPRLEEVSPAELAQGIGFELPDDGEGDAQG